MIYKHWLKFISLDAQELYQISEPVGFTSITSVLEQESKKYARDYSYGAIDKIEFIDAYTELADTIQAINPQGDTSEHLDYGLQWLLHIYRTKGFETKVEYFISEGDIFHSLGMLDFTDKDLTDGYTFIKCKLIQNDKIADVKRRLDDKFNAFSDKDAKENTITPMPTFNYLKRATPLFQRSSWSSQDKTFTFSGLGVSFNPFRQIVSSEIKNTFTILEDFIQWNTTGDNPYVNYAYLGALSSINNVEVSFKLKGLATRSGGSLTNKISLFLFKCREEDFEDTYLTATSIYQFDLTDVTSLPIDLDLNVTLPDLDAGERIYSFFAYSRISGGGTITFKLEDSLFEIKGSVISIDQVIKASRYIDLIKQASKFTGNLPINAPLFDVNGLHYKNVVFSKKMISQNIDSFNTTPKAVFESVNEVNCDFEINSDVIDILHEDSFYDNVEIGAFNISPDYNISQSFNDRFMLNKFDYNYKTFEQDRNSEGTNQSFHTDAQFRLLNENVENVKEIKNDFVRDPIATQEMVNLEITKPTTSTDQDDKIYIENYTELPPNSYGGFSANLLMRVVDGNRLEILNSDNGDNDIVLNWNTIGVEVGSTFEIVIGENLGVYTVFQITNNVITLTPIGFIPDFDGISFIKVRYLYLGILYQTRTNQGFSLIEGLNNANEMPNLFYSIKRNLKNFATQLSTALIYAKKDIICAYFKNNGNLTTQLTTEAEPITENAPILYDSLPEPRLNAKIHKLTLVAGFSEVIEYFERYKVNKGLIRCIDYSGKVIFVFPKKAEYNWFSGEFQIDGEEKYSTEYLMLNYVDGLLYVNDVAYNLSGVSDWWRFSNDYLKLYDEKSRPLSNEYKYNFVNLNGIIFNSKEELVNALINL